MGTKKPMLPVIAVAIDNSLYYFQNFNPLVKFDLPAVEFSEKEKELWNSLKDVQPGDEEMFVATCEKLYNLRESGTKLSTLSSELLTFEDIRQ